MNFKSFMETDLPWYFHGVYCTKEQAEQWRAMAQKDICPWCGKTIARRHNNVNSHLKVCPKKPIVATHSWANGV